MATTELKPCMRCGSDLVNTCGATALKYARAFCDSCGLSTKYHTSIQEAIADWNTRPDPWVLTSDKLPEEGVPVWGEVQEHGREYISQIVRIDLGWFGVHSPFMERGVWGFMTSSVCYDPPKRWRYML